MCSWESGWWRILRGYGSWCVNRAANGGTGCDGEVQLPILPLVMTQGYYWMMMVADAVCEPISRRL